MPLNFAEVWKNRVENKLVATDQAPWLAGIEELDTAIIEMGSGTASEKNLIHLPTSQFMPEVLINNLTYPIALQSYADDETIIQLDKFQTLVTTLSDEEIMGAAYRRTSLKCVDQKVGQKRWEKEGYGNAGYSAQPSRSRR